MDNESSLDRTPYLAGYTLSTDFPTTPGAYDTSINSNRSDIFVSKITYPATAPAPQTLHRLIVELASEVFQK